MTHRRRSVSIPMIAIILMLAVMAGHPVAADTRVRGTGDLGIIVERAAGRVQIIETSGRARIGEVAGLGDLSHATAVFSRDGRYAFVFGRDGGLSKIDLLTARLEKRIVQAGNSVGGAISQDGSLIAVANYEPGGIKVFAADTLDLVTDIPAVEGSLRSKVVGLEDASDARFVFSLYDAGEIWIADLTDPAAPAISRFSNVGQQPYDGLVTPDGRYYIAGLFGEDGLALLDLWQPEHGVRRILDGYGRGEQPLPVYKMPHLEGWAQAGGSLFLPAVGRHEVLVVDASSWQERARIPTHGQPVFSVARPDGRHVWVNFAHPLNDTIQIIDTRTLAVIHTFQAGKAIMHMEFTPRGEQVWVSVRDEDRVDIYDTRTFLRLASVAAEKPSGIFLSARAHRIGF